MPPRVGLRAQLVMVIHVGIATIQKEGHLRKAFEIPLDVSVLTEIEGDMKKRLVILFQKRDHSLLLLGIGDPVDDPTLLAMHKLGLVLQNEPEVLERLPFLMSRWQVVA